MKQSITTMQNGYEVFVDTEASHAATHIKDQPELLQLAKEFLSTQSFEDDEVAVQHDMGRIIGTMDIVETTDADEIVYAKRLNRDNYTRFVKHRSPVPTSLISVVLRKRSKDTYELWSVWIGPKVPTFPGDDRVMPNSKEFWAKHALAWGEQAVQEGTETTICPW